MADKTIALEIIVQADKANSVEELTQSLESLENKLKNTRKSDKNFKPLFDATKRVNRKLNEATKAMGNLNKATKEVAKSSKVMGQGFKGATNMIETFGVAGKGMQKGMMDIQSHVSRGRRGFNRLGHSMNQITRELPAFTYGMQTGFMGISNNIPILVDQLKRIKQENIELAKQGIKTKSSISQLAGAFFSWGTLLSIGVTLLTVYGAELFTWVGNMFKSVKAINAQKEAQIELIKVKKEGIDSSQREIAKLGLLNIAVQDTSRSEKERSEILKTLRDKYGEDIQHLTDREILINGLGKAEGTLARNIIKRAVADAAASKIGENAIKLIELRAKMTKLANKQLPLSKKVKDELSKGVEVYSKYGNNVDRALKAQSKLNELNIEVSENQAQQNKIETENLLLQKEALKGVDSFINKSKKEKDVIIKKTKVKKDKEKDFTSFIKAEQRKQALILSDARGKERLAIKNEYDDKLIKFKDNDILLREAKRTLRLQNIALEDKYAEEDRIKQEDKDKKEKDRKDKIAIEDEKRRQDADDKDQEAKEKRAAFDKKLKDNDIALAMSGYSALTDIAHAFANGQDANSKQAFERNKAVSIAETIVSTIMAAQKAYASQMALTTPDAPIRAAIAAGIATASGLARVAAIKSTQYQSPTANVPNPSGNIPTGSGGGIDPTRFGSTIIGNGNKTNRNPLIVKNVISVQDINKANRDIGHAQTRSVVK